MSALSKLFPYPSRSLPTRLVTVGSDSYAEIASAPREATEQSYVSSTSRLSNGYSEGLRI